MKRIAFILPLILAASICHGAPKTVATKNQKQGQQQSEEKDSTQKSQIKSTGPVGLGAIKIGMPMDAIAQLQESDGVYLAEKLSPYESKHYTPKPGVEKYSTLVTIPNTSKAIDSVLTFSTDKLIEIYLNFDKSPDLYEKIKNQITEKYGQGAIKDDQREEQCIYKNGANFKIKTGTAVTTWRQFLKNGEAIETTLFDTTIAMCPSNLRHGSTGGVELKSLYIRKIEQSSETKKIELF